MKKRLVQVFGFVISTLGWVFVLCTMAMDNWRTSQVGGQGGSFIIKVGWYWSNLWRDCYTDSTSVSNCRSFAEQWSVEAYVQGVRGLIICGVTLGFFGVVFCFPGMECTHIGGKEKTKDKLLLAGSIFHFVGGVSNIAAYCLYINRIVRTAYSSTLQPGTLRYNIGPPIYLGMVACFFIFVGAILYAATVYKVYFTKGRVVTAYGTRTYMAPRSAGRNTYGYNRSSRQYGYLGSGQASSSRISTISKTLPSKMSDRDAFV
ncbi:claudin-10-like [Aplochiton taeniatus]